MRFCSDLELAVFLWRNFASKFEDRALVLLHNVPICEQLELITKQEKSWRFDESSICSSFESIGSEKILLIKERLRNFEFSIAGEQENGWLEDSLELKITIREAEDEIPSELREVTDLMLCLLTASMDQRDSWAAARFFSGLCADTLPALKRLCSKSQLTLLQTLFSYIMEANIQENSGSDEVLSANIDFLKSFDRAIDSIHEEMISATDLKTALQKALRIAADFLLATPAYSCSSKVRNAQKLVFKQACEVIVNFEQLRPLLKDYKQEAPEFITHKERVLRMVIDRFTVLDIATPLTEVAPVFKTPKLATPMCSVATPSSTTTFEDSESVTPVTTKIAAFVNNSTPTPVRPPSLTIIDECSEDSGIYEDLLEEEKENIDPNATEKKMESKVVTPQRAPSGKGAKRGLRQLGSNITNVTKRGKTTKTNLPVQRSIMSFFAR